MSLADLAHLTEEPAWMRRAACRNLDSNLFFPQTPGASRTTQIARKICARCPVTRPCLDWALSFPSHYDFGIFAGTDQRQRRVMRKERAA